MVFHSPEEEIYQTPFLKLVIQSGGARPSFWSSSAVHITSLQTPERFLKLDTNMKIDKVPGDGNLILMRGDTLKLSLQHIIQKLILVKTTEAFNEYVHQHSDKIDADVNSMPIYC